jgi:hypothetical protein
MRRLGTLYPGMHEDEHGYLIVSHKVATGADCDGCPMVVAHGDVADLVCNSCCAVVDMVDIDRVGPRLMELDPWRFAAPAVRIAEA